MPPKDDDRHKKPVHHCQINSFIAQLLDLNQKYYTEKLPYNGLHIRQKSHTTENNNVLYIV